MKFTSVCIAVLLTACSGFGSEAEAEQSMTTQTDHGRVYYYAFDIERITGLHESEIEQYGSQFCIGRHDFEQSMLTAPERVNNLQYNKLDVRAKVVFPDKQYFIDHAGVVSGGQEYILLDKGKFIGYLKPVRKC